MAFSSISPWQIDGEKVGTMADFIFLGSKFTADGDWSHKIKRRLLLRRQIMTNLDSVLKSRAIILLTNVHIVKAMVLPPAMDRYESWTIKKDEGQRTSLVAQLVKNLPAVQKTWVWSLGWEDPMEKGKATHSSILAWKIPWYSPYTVRKESDMTDWRSFSYS